MLTKAEEFRRKLAKLASMPVEKRGPGLQESCIEEECESDPRLRLWIERMKAVDHYVKEQIDAIPGPKDLIHSLLALESRVIPPSRSFAYTIFFLFCVIAFGGWVISLPKPDVSGSLRDFAYGLVLSTGRMDVGKGPCPSDLNEVIQLIQHAGGPSPLSALGRLTKQVKPVWWQVFDKDGRAVTILGLQAGRCTIRLFVTNAFGLAGVPNSGQIVRGWVGEQDNWPILSGDGASRGDLESGECYVAWVEGTLLCILSSDCGMGYLETLIKL